MGFLKNVGKTLKREISFKNLAKVATKAASFVPGVGGVISDQMQALQDAAQAKKDLRNSQQSNDLQQIENDKMRVLQSNLNASKYAKSISKSVAGSIISATSDEALVEVSSQAKQATGKAGAMVVDSTISEWLKLHLKEILIGSAVVIYFWVQIIPMVINPKKRGYRSTYRKY